MWLEKSFLKKFHDSCPSTEYMATRFAESIPSLKNLRPIPGAVLSLLVSGSNAKESLGKDALVVEETETHLASPCCAPLKIPE